MPYDGGPVCAVYSPDRSFVVTVTEDGKAFLTDGNSGAAIGAPRDLGAPGRWVDFNKDGKRFITTAGTKAVIWSVDNAAPDGTSDRTSGRGRSNAANGALQSGWKLDRHRAAMTGPLGCGDQFPQAGRGAEETRGPGDQRAIQLDGKLVVTTGADSAIIVWDTAKWEPVGLPVILPGEIYRR